MKKKLSLLLALVMTIGLMCPLTVSAAQQDIKVLVNGSQVNFDVQPQIINSRTMVPMRAIFEKLGLTVSWDNDSKTVTATDSDTTIVMQVGEYSFTKDGTAIYLDSPAVIINSRTLVPVRAISEALSMKVDWDASTYTVTISDITETGHYIQSEAMTIQDETKIPDGTYDTLLDPYSAEYTSDGNMTVDGIIYTYDVYDIVDIAQLAVGDTIQFKCEDVKVISVDREDGWIDINGGYESGNGFTLTTDEDSNGWRTVIYDDYADGYAATGNIQFTVQKGSVLEDELVNPQPGMDPTVVEFDDLAAYMEENEVYDCFVTVENGMATDLYRSWQP